MEEEEEMEKGKGKEEVERGKEKEKMKKQKKKEKDKEESVVVLKEQRDSHWLIQQDSGFATMLFLIYKEQKKRIVFAGLNKIRASVFFTLQGFCRCPPGSNMLLKASQRDIQFITADYHIPISFSLLA